ncbi:hypothetical protein W911_16850 [Hyphomicrobium nitrativorans NL23]|uniref:Uncharacterized protein n=1 Tax=Hyphomicrobium nitrativorans NL23 TaxID=1029756 RepID=V5SIX1_9HYPH|nr:hypothetical protein W911_16850 [Hyphomicrobium nitrativorans NL23]
MKADVLAARLAARMFHLLSQIIFLGHKGSV